MGPAWPCQEWVCRHRRFRGGRLTVNATSTDFVRDVSTNSDAFSGYQTSYYSEASYLHAVGPHHMLVLGLNVNGEQLTSSQRSATPLRNPYQYATLGTFAQDDWQLADRLRLQAGLRLVHHNRYGNFLMPRLALLFRASSAVTARLNGGLGYRAPVPYINSLDEWDYPLVLAAMGLVEFADHFSAGLQASYIGRQYLSDGRRTPSYPLFATLVRYHTGASTVALNAKNVVDYRQTRCEKVVQAPLGNPVFSKLWAPVGGQVGNLANNKVLMAKRRAILTTAC